MQLMQKTCRRCGKLKDISEFGTYTLNLKTKLKTYVRSYCTQCYKEIEAARRADPELRKKKNARNRAYYRRKKLGIKLPPRQSHEERMANLAKYKRKRYHSDMNYRTRRRLSSQMHKFITGRVKKSRMRKLVGISAEECRQHIEAQFLEGMSWDNYGQWHVDHIVPCDSFDLTDAEQQRECFHYTNVQPLWGEENTRKHATITPYVAQRKWTGEEWVNTLAPWLIAVDVTAADVST